MRPSQWTQQGNTCIWLSFSLTLGSLEDHWSGKGEVGWIGPEVILGAYSWISGIPPCMFSVNSTMDETPHRAALWLPSSRGKRGTRHSWAPGKTGPWCWAQVHCRGAPVISQSSRRTWGSFASLHPGPSPDVRCGLHGSPSTTRPWSWRPSGHKSWKLCLGARPQRAWSASSRSPGSQAPTSQRPCRVGGVRLLPEAGWLLGGECTHGLGAGEVRGDLLARQSPFNTKHFDPSEMSWCKCEAEIQVHFFHDFEGLGWALDLLFLSWMASESLFNFFHPMFLHYCGGIVILVLSVSRAILRIKGNDSLESSMWISNILKMYGVVLITVVPKNHSH